jgi:hypothetical protein
LGRFHEVNEAAYSGIKQARKAVLSAVKQAVKEKVGKEDSAMLLHLLSQTIFEGFQDFLFTPGLFCLFAYGVVTGSLAVVEVVSCSTCNLLVACKSLVPSEQRSRFFADIFHRRATPQVTQAVEQFKSDVAQVKLAASNDTIAHWFENRFVDHEQPDLISSTLSMLEAAIEAVWELHLAFHGLIQLPTMIELGCKTKSELAKMQKPTGKAFYTPSGPNTDSIDWTILLEVYTNMLEVRGVEQDDDATSSENPGPYALVSRVQRRAKVPTVANHLETQVQSHPGFFISLVADATTVQCQAYGVSEKVYHRYVEVPV